MKELLAELNEGKKKVDATIEEGEKTVSQTGVKGQAKIKSDLHKLTKDIENLKIECSENLDSVSQTVESLQSFDKECEELSIWLKDVKSRFTNPQLKSSLQEKQNQVAELKVRSFHLITQSVRVSVNSFINYSVMLILYDCH